MLVFILCLHLSLWPRHRETVARILFEGCTYFSLLWPGQPGQHGRNPLPLCFSLSLLLSMVYEIIGGALLIQSTITYRHYLSMSLLFRDEALPSLTQVQREDDIYALPPLQEEEKNR